MERVLTANEMQLCEKFNIEDLGFSSQTFIERAGIAVADEIIKRLRGGRVLVCIGKGNNGADGEVIANILSRTHGFSVAKINVSNGIFKIFEKKFDIIVDCVFGTGLNRNIEEKYFELITKINNSGAYIVSCDIPSGINADTGLVMGIAVKANLTIAIQEFKLGHFLADGKDYCGKIIAKDIGISVWGDDYVKKFSDNDLTKFFPKRKQNVHKGSFFNCALIGGSKEFSGSILLSNNALCALKMGLGKSFLCVPESVYVNYVGLNPETILSPIKDFDGHVVFDEKFFKEILKVKSIGIGMGLGVSAEGYKIITYLIENYTGRLLIDADGLNCLGKYGIEILNNKKCEIVLTPHLGEFSRLCNLDKGEVLQNPIQIVKNFAKKYGVTLLLKNATSIISDGQEVFINTTGDSGLSKGGSGDVLSGIIVGLLTRDESVLNCTCAGAYLFGKSGEFASKEDNEYTVTASDVILSIPKVINSL